MKAIIASSLVLCVAVAAIPTTGYAASVLVPKVSVPRVNVPHAATLSPNNSGSQPHLQYNLHNAYITKFHLSGGSSGSAPQETTTFVYGTLGVQYQPQTTGKA